MRRTWMPILLVGLLALAAVACGRGQATIPPGATTVSVTLAGDEVRLEPSTVPAGDVYLVLDTPGMSVSFAMGQDSAEATPGPLTDEALERLAGGSSEGTAMTSFGDHGCSPEQRAEDRGRLGPCGTVFLQPLVPGRYAFFAGDPEPGGPVKLAVLVVQP